MKAQELTRAKLWCLDKDAWSIEFMFNPEFGSMSLSREVNWSPAGNGYDPWKSPLEYDDGAPDSLSFTMLLDQTTLGEPDPADALAFQANFLSALASFLDDETNDESVLPEIAALWRLTVPIHPDGHSDDDYQLRPPIVAFVWDDFEFLGAVTSLSVDMLLFTAEGVPKRAKVEVRMTGKAFSGQTTLADFIAGTYTPPTGEAAGSRDASRLDLLKEF